MPASEPATSQKPIAAGTTATIHSSAATMSRRQETGRRGKVGRLTRGAPNRPGAACGAVGAVTRKGGTGTGNLGQSVPALLYISPYAIAYG